ncbi:MULTISPECIES: phage integrase SAM-like domain-containing protein [Elizabethkingia]|uniref:Integrase n=2 Tax=Elizabethkingia anophelis TaxID=1117645 RepID=A0A455ZFL1_9FLAO|nr:phage integrase SAM-like domain-containing protein [Elizabethkingia anophelis]ATC37694.1 integrase [Elizabethkingia anophelis R26]ATC41373.1 integrase [Elizabethkingia anophelis Ag1]ATC45050.1 integrase [Elizabethkingia anophelis]ATC48726.1 integrase [Elizabethkingia anophelis]WJJ99671.1 phage integrase SAM-like domain-containing protein [Elizabethkingia anophelis]
MTLDFTLSGNTILKNINLILNTDYEYFNLHTSLRIPYEEWDEEKKRPKNIYLKKDKKLNNKLNFLKKEIASFIIQRQIDKKQINKKILSKLIKNLIKQPHEQVSESSFLFYIHQYINERKDFICNSTFKRYKVFYNLIQRFEGYIMKNLFIDDINMKFVKKLIIYGKEEGYSENTIYRTIDFVKTILNFLEGKGIRTAVREINVRKEKQQKYVLTLSEKEIIQIKNTCVPDELQQTKDWLIISCYTGQRFSDFMKFSTCQIIEVDDKKCMKFIQKKTKNEITLPLHPVVMDILYKNENTFPKSTDIITYNKQVKLIAKMAGINSTLKVKIRTKHRVISLITEKWRAISSHIGRRSFATNFYGKIPTPLLMRATGHSTEQVFLKYINYTDNEHIIPLSNHFDRIYNSIIL